MRLGSKGMGSLKQFLKQRRGSGRHERFRMEMCMRGIDGAILTSVTNETAHLAGDLGRA